MHACGVSFIRSQQGINAVDREYVFQYYNTVNLHLITLKHRVNRIGMTIVHLTSQSEKLSLTLDSKMVVKCSKTIQVAAA